MTPNFSETPYLAKGTVLLVDIEAPTVPFNFQREDSEKSEARARGYWLVIL